MRDTGDLIKVGDKVEYYSLPMKDGLAIQ